MDPRNQPAQDDEDLLRDIRKILDDRHDADDPYERGFADKLSLKWCAPIASVAALTAQPLAALPPYGCGVPLAGCERLAGWQSLRHAFCGARLSDLSLRGRYAPVAISQHNGR